VATALIVFSFDPLVRFGDSVVTWETIGIAISIFVALVLAGLIALRNGSRVDDLLFVVLGIVPGAVIGGRIGYLLLYPTFLGGDAGRLIDPGLGGMELSLAVQNALSRLSDDHREAVLLKVYQGFKFEEMAEILSCPVSTVKSRLYTALDLLKQTLAPANMEGAK